MIAQELKVGRTYTLRIRGGLTGPPTFDKDVTVVIREHTQQTFPPFAVQVVVSEPRKRTRYYLPVDSILAVVR